ncbi:flagellar hook capping FlgD N-terminal domain-containing protein [Roseinatronobacter alkalisoli]|uniref:Basal-body rod modification protein FlgD n=1 Tax=Roseinatronobacter alkalisoli TaxID=3028235 RepID=A0ABT5T9T4_9RHOB|nr:flagellar hook capping FlgD N-terminal domain-containing protein [Roseinatronobacter sp. HJB301]MDD7971736.1 flagellar hook capping FlgD N-terminal domain-containing protein [Roseinatronobacter sp. HJB301]
MFSMIDTATTTNAASGSSAPPTKSGFSDGSDFAMFLRMLTTQMQNQNPLNPVEASDFAVQLATFSGVEQQIQTNQLLGRLADQMIFSDLANWLHKDVATDAPIYFSGAPLTVNAPPVAHSTSRDVVISSVDGRELARVPVSAQRGDITLDLGQDLPDPLPHGAYQFTVEDFQGSGSLGTSKAVQYAPVQEVRNNNGQIVLVLEGGVQISSAQITAVR